MKIFHKINPPESRPLTRWRQPSEKGFALLIVIVVLLLLTFMASQYIMMVRTEVQIANNTKMNFRSRFLAEAGLNLAIFRLLDMPTSDNDLADEKFYEGITYETFLSAGKVKYYAVNETGKIDLNSAPAGLLELFLKHYELDEEQVATIVDSLADWRDTDNFHRLHGAEQDFYKALIDPYIPRNGAIVDPAEFFLINGTDVLAGRFAASEVFTVYNPGSKINFNSLTPAMLNFLAGGNAEIIEAYSAARAQSENLAAPKTAPPQQILTATQAQQILGDERYALLSPYLTYSSNRNPNFFIVGEGLAGYSAEDEQTKTQQTAGIKISTLISVERAGLKYLSWKESPL